VPLLGDGQADRWQRGLVILGDGQADSGQRGLVVIDDIGRQWAGQRWLVQLTYMNGMIMTCPGMGGGKGTVTLATDTRSA